MTDTEVAWAAGFFDGEGWISVNHQAGGYITYVVGISQMDVRPLQRFLAAVGCTETQGRSHGNARKMHHGRIHQLMWSGDGAQRVLDVLWPWLSEPKREQAERVLAEYTEQKAA